MDLDISFKHPKQKTSFNFSFNACKILKTHLLKSPSNNNRGNEHVLALRLKEQGKRGNVYFRHTCTRNGLIC